MSKGGIPRGVAIENSLGGLRGGEPSKTASVRWHPSTLPFGPRAGPRRLPSGADSRGEAKKTPGAPMGEVRPGRPRGATSARACAGPWGDGPQQGKLSVEAAGGHGLFSYDLYSYGQGGRRPRPCPTQSRPRPEAPAHKAGSRDRKGLVRGTCCCITRGVPCGATRAGVRRAAGDGTPAALGRGR